MSKHLFRILFFLFCTGTIVLSLLNKEATDYRLVTFYHLDWFNAQLSYRIFSALFLFLLALVLLGLKSKILTSLVLSFLLIGSLDALLDLFGFGNHPSFFISIKQPIWSWISLAIAWICFGLHERKSIAFPIKWWKIPLALILATGFSFIKVIYLDDYIATAANDKHLDRQEIKSIAMNFGIELQAPNMLIPFFSTSCEHCHKAAKKIAISNQNGSLPPTLLVFSEDSLSVNWFLKTVDAAEIPHISIKHRKFISLAGHRFPSVFWIENNKSTQWVGGQFNNLALSKVCR